MKRKTASLLVALATTLAATALGSISAVAAAPAETSPVASTPDMFPVHLQSYRTNIHDSWTFSLANLTFKSSVPGLSFCVTYGSTHGASIKPRLYGVGHISQGDLESCLTAGRDGLVSDTVRVEPGKSADALLTANIVLVDNRASVETVPLVTDSAASKR